eukprot:NODE_99_length_20465_cov_0.827654.p18 type:complete len:176 gc:universal NODE_99_length_20465_cov_0.827654:8348-8875(+)
MIYILLQLSIAYTTKCGWQNANIKCDKGYYCGVKGLCGKTVFFKQNCQPASSSDGLCADDGICGLINGIHKFCGPGRSCYRGKCGSEINVINCDTGHSWPGTCGRGNCGIVSSRGIYNCPFTKPYCHMSGIVGSCNQVKEGCDPQFSQENMCPFSTPITVRPGPHHWGGDLNKLA